MNPNNGGPTLATLSKLYIEEGKRGGTWREASTFEVERALRNLLKNSSSRRMLPLYPALIELGGVLKHVE